MECLIRDNMLVNCLFADHQHGFVLNRLYIAHLLCVMEYYTKWLDNVNLIDSLILDFLKVFHY